MKVKYRGNRYVCPDRTLKKYICFNTSNGTSMYGFMSVKMKNKKDGIKISHFFKESRKSNQIPVF